MPPETKKTAKKRKHDRTFRKPPEFIQNKATGQTFHVGEILGTGGYARCYKVRDVGTNELFACKVMSNSLLVERQDLEKVSLEIVLQRAMKCENIVKLITYFQDDANLYIIVELCKNGTLQELVKRRKVLTELEARYFLRQILFGIRFLHSSNIVHRDIKTSNIFIHETKEKMTLKIGDFGLATLLDYYGQRKSTICGTPNFLPPEILTKAGHSFEADIWCVGVILYNMLFGYAPFQRKDVQQTYDAIKNLSYTIPPGKISVQAKNLIESILVLDPSKRAKLHHIFGSDFMTMEQFPKTLPNTILTQRVRFTFREPAFAFNGKVYGSSGEDKNRPDSLEPKKFSPTAEAEATQVKGNDEQEQDPVIPINEKAKATVDATAAPKRSRRIATRNSMRQVSSTCTSTCTGCPCENSNHKVIEADS